MEQLILRVIFKFIATVFRWYTFTDEWFFEFCRFTAHFNSNGGDADKPHLTYADISCVWFFSALNLKDEESVFNFFAKNKYEMLLRHGVDSKNSHEQSFFSQQCKQFHIVYTKYFIKFLRWKAERELNDNCYLKMLRRYDKYKEKHMWDGWRLEG